MHKSSAEWLKEPDYKHITVLDPDGWDRMQYHYSFNVEQISREEFERRLMNSTCIFRRAA